MDTPALSIVCPLYNEAAVLEELIRRLTRSAERTGLSFELVLVDDASTDESPARFAALAADFAFRVIRLARRRGQFGATQAGLEAALGPWVAVLDGDLQDPPELLPALLAAQHEMPSDTGLVLAVKRSRKDSLPFRAALALHHALLALFAKSRLPLGAGSFCLMRRELAKQIAAAPLTNTNLCALWALLDVPFITVDYEKAARYDAHSRVGALGLLAESLWSLWVAGALAPILASLAAAGFGAGLCWQLASGAATIPDGVLALFAGASGLALLAFFLMRRRRRLARALKNP